MSSFKALATNYFNLYKLTTLWSMIIKTKIFTSSSSHRLVSTLKQGPQVLWGFFILVGQSGNNSGWKKNLKDNSEKLHTGESPITRISLKVKRFIKSVENYILKNYTYSDIFEVFTSVISLITSDSYRKPQNIWILQTNRKKMFRPKWGIMAYIIMGETDDRFNPSI